MATTQICSSDQLRELNSVSTDKLKNTRTFCAALQLDFSSSLLPDPASYSYENLYIILVSCLLLYLSCFVGVAAVIEERGASSCRDHFCVPSWDRLAGWRCCNFRGLLAKQAGLLLSLEKYSE